MSAKSNGRIATPSQSTQTVVEKPSAQDSAELKDLNAISESAAWIDENLRNGTISTEIAKILYLNNVSRVLAVKLRCKIRLKEKTITTKPITLGYQTETT